ncbi:MAG: hypothetical protein GY760_29725, partial [Deltaproteobacteria bacterium]|nr:hypothetical protein [Deltaproteobacteria bacterium]
AKNKEPLIDTPSNVARIVIPKEETDAVQESSTDGVDENKQAEDVQKVEEGTSEPVIREITEEEEKEQQEVKAEEPVAEPAPIQNDLPENINKLVDFMRETGGTMQDYIRLSTNYEDVDRDVLVKEYYKSTKPHLSQEEIDFMIEDTFAFDEDIDEERDIKRKKLAYKEEVSKARKFLEDTKKKYYDDIKLKSPSLSEDQQKASDFFNRYKEDQKRNSQNHEKFKTQTEQLFNKDFEGFDFSLGEKKFRYGVQNAAQVGEKQSDISNFIGKFLGEDGTIKDTKGYHKALYTGANADKIANHFYEQGKADAIRDVVNKSNNTSTEARKAAPVESARFGAYKVKSVSGANSAKLKIKKFKN